MHDDESWLIVSGEPAFTVDLGSTGVTVELTDERSDPDPLPADVLIEVVRTTLEAEGVVAGSVDIIALDASAIAELNRTHMGHDGPTDVLSFPLDDPSEGDSFGFVPHVGDIVLCPEVARGQAADHAGTYDAELHLLVIHGALHLLGHDHAEPDERALMQAAEATHLQRYGFDHPGDQQ